VWFGSHVQRGPTPHECTLGQKHPGTTPPPGFFLLFSKIGDSPKPFILSSFSNGWLYESPPMNLCFTSFRTWARPNLSKLVEGNPGSGLLGAISCEFPGLSFTQPPPHFCLGSLFCFAANLAKRSYPPQGGLWHDRLLAWSYPGFHSPRRVLTCQHGRTCINTFQKNVSMKLPSPLPSHYFFP